VFALFLFSVFVLGFCVWPFWALGVVRPVVGLVSIGGGTLLLPIDALPKQALLPSRQSCLGKENNYYIAINWETVFYDVCQHLGVLMTLLAYLS